MKSKDIIKLLEEEIEAARFHAANYHKLCAYDTEQIWQSRLGALLEFRLKLPY